MVVKCFGGRGPLCQVERIEQGLILEGHRLCSDDEIPDAIYSNDPNYYDEALKFKLERAPNAKVLFNVLDIPENCFPPDGDFTFERLHSLGETLRKADAITCISKWTQSQIHRYFGYSCFVIGNPIKNVSPDKRLSGERPYPYRVLIAGRALDPNKRIRTLGIPALIGAGFNESEVAVVGGEWPGWGTNLGLVSDETLNDLYNSVDFLMFSSLQEGLGLPVLEALACGVVPIFCSDLTTFADLRLPRYFGCYPSVTALALRLRMLCSNSELLESERQYGLNLSDGIIEDFSGRMVARRIADVVKKLIS